MAEENQRTARATDPTPPRGIFDCDDAYRTPLREDYERLFATGMVVLDTNVLLNLYRSNERTRKDTFSVLNRLRDRLWIPHQVLSEFWRNRDLPSVRGHHRTKAKDACAALEKAHRSMSDALDRWLRDVHLSNDANAKERLHRGKSSIENTLKSLKVFIQEQAERDALKDASATHSDPVLTELDKILSGRIGAPFSDERLAAAIQEAEKRAEKYIPPGYEDFKDKPLEQAAGDYILWAQLLDEAERRRSDVLLVTGDVKADWWVAGTNHTPARPRTELTVELRNRTATQLYMLTPSQLLARANEIFNMRVDERSVSDLETAEREQTHPWDYNRAIEEILDRQFPEARTLSLDEQIGTGVPTPIPDIMFVHPDIKIGIETKRYTRAVKAGDMQYLGEMIEKHELHAVLVVSHTQVSTSAIEYLRDLSNKSGSRTAWVRIRGDQIDHLAAQEHLRMSIDSLISETPSPQTE